MQALFSPTGKTALRGLSAETSMLVFDLDGTLAPIVSRPNDAAVPKATAARMTALCTRWRVAVISGRKLSNAACRLGFTPGFLAGNHGAESTHAPQSRPWRQALDACRERLHRNAAELLQLGIQVEDKHLSLALHYRSATSQAAALVWLNHFAAACDRGVTVAHGHGVLNITPIGAWDKGDAMLCFTAECGATNCLVVGDDANDEPMFMKAPPGSVTARIGAFGQPTAARFSLASQAQTDAVLDHLLSL